MPGQRRLFMTHAGELAHLLARAVGPNAMTAQFIRSYAAHHNRQALLGNAQQFREMEFMIAREALLLMAVELRHRVPRAFASGAHGVPRPEEAAVARVFAAEFLASLRRIVSGSAQDPAEFDHDLELYDRWTMRQIPRTAVDAAEAETESPFPDRCAMLLDPSMMEAARREAVNFEFELVRESVKIFDHLGRHGLRRPTSSPRRVHRPARPMVKKSKKTTRPILKNAPKKIAKKSAKKKPSSARKRLRPRKPARSRKPARRRKR